MHRSTEKVNKFSNIPKMDLKTTHNSKLVDNSVRIQHIEKSSINIHRQALIQMD